MSQKTYKMPRKTQKMPPKLKENASNNLPIKCQSIAKYVTQILSHQSHENIFFLRK